MLRQPSIWTQNYFVLKMGEKLFWPLRIVFPHWNMPCLQMNSQVVLMILDWPRDMLAMGFFFSILLQGCTRFYSFCFKIGKIRGRIHVSCKVFFFFARFFSDHTFMFLCYQLWAMLVGQLCSNSRGWIRTIFLP